MAAVAAGDADGALLIRAYREGLARVARSPGLVAFLYLANLALALVLAVPLAARLEADLAGTGSAARTTYGFDYSWWSRWSEGQSGWQSSLGPDVAGSGFVFRDLDALLGGGLFASGSKDSPGIPGVILGLALVALVVQTFLTGGALSVLRGGRAEWTARGLFHGAGFYFGRLVRLALLAILVQYLLARAAAPLGARADDLARAAVSETTAFAWFVGRRAVLLVAILMVHMVMSLSKTILVLEDRNSAVLATASAVAFCVLHPLRTIGHYACVAGTGLVLLVAFTALDGVVPVSGYRTQLPAWLLSQALIVGMVTLRLALFAGQMALYRGADHGTPRSVD